jgi:hypothetical protein
MAPILIITFNRPDFFVKLIDIICKAEPTSLYIYSDAPRNSNNDDELNVNEIRAIVENTHIVNCEIHYKFEEVNKGCKYGPISAINWFFDNVESGIILEDDCMPSFSFFEFANCCLEEYRFNDKVYSISGTNICPSKITSNSAYASIYHLPWGWATWKRAWILFDYECNFFKNQEFIIKFSGEAFLFKYGWGKITNLILDGTHHMWDPQWNLFCFYKSAYSIYPPVNLIKNIGHDSRATHTKNFDSKFVAIETIENVKISFKDIDLLNTYRFDKYIMNNWWSITYYNYFKDLIIFYSKLIFEKI